MKILKLIFQNINSIYGKCSIDFTSPEYSYSGIFAITGPTGSGKSTILDAISLALYGKTPRISNITKKSNEVMSKDTGECMAEVLFESSRGIFRASWEQHRANKKPYKPLQEPYHEISDGITGKIITNKKSEVENIIEEKTGLDFKRFTKSVFLAQGEFDSFLKANPDEKAQILEQITDTDIYSKISKNAYERYVQEREKLNFYREKTENRTPLSTEEEAKLSQKLKDLDSIKNEKNNLKENFTQEIFLINDINRINSEINTLKEKMRLTESQIEAFAPERKKLEMGLKANLISGTFDAVHTTRTEIRDASRELNEHETNHTKIRDELDIKITALERAGKDLEKARKEVEENASLFKKIRELDKNISEYQSKIEDAVKKTEKISKESGALNNELLLQEREQKRLKGNLMEIEQYLENNKEEQWLSEGLSGAEEKIASLFRISGEMEEEEEKALLQKKTLKTLEERLKGFELPLNNWDTELKRKKNEIETLKNNLDMLLGEKTLQEYEYEKEELFNISEFTEKIINLKKYREELEEGKPCPLCGSSEHPYTKGALPQKNEVEIRKKELTALITKGRKIEIEIREKEEANERIKEEIRSLEKIEARINGEKDTALILLKAGEEKIKKLKQEIDRIKEEIGKQGFTGNLSEIKGKLKEFQLKKKALTAKRDGKINIEKELTAIAGQLNAKQNILKTLLDNLSQERTDIEHYHTELNKHTKVRSELFGDKEVDKEEKNLKALLDKAEKVREESTEKVHALQISFTENQTQANSLKDFINRGMEKLEGMEKHLSILLEKHSFQNEEHFIASRISEETQEELRKKASGLDDAKKEGEQKLNDRIRLLNEKNRERKFSLSAEEVAQNIEEVKRELKTIMEESAYINNRLRENEEMKKELAEQKHLYERQEKEYRKYSLFNELIGSHDGKKFRKFAQEVTFEILLEYANSQLRKMNDRYSLVRSSREEGGDKNSNNAELSINVIDNYQAGKERSVKNLSGGETFIVSLALSLGLSNMTSQKIKIDSLFLDEGFGTLDDETLDTALNALSKLQMEGKIIGIISHVNALKERITPQITVTPIGNGKSGIKGAGVLRS